VKIAGSLMDQVDDLDWDGRNIVHFVHVVHLVHSKIYRAFAGSCTQTEAFLAQTESL